jgi:hypothetical protein
MSSSMPSHIPSQKTKPNHNLNEQTNELWFAKFFIGSMISIAFLTVILSFLPSPSGLRTQPQNKSSSLISLVSK